MYCSLGWPQQFSWQWSSRICKDHWHGFIGIPRGWFIFCTSIHYNDLNDFVGNQINIRIGDCFIICTRPNDGLMNLLELLSAHRNDHLSASLRSFSNDLKTKEPQSDRKRKKITKKEDKAAKDVLHIADSWVWISCWCLQI